MRSKLLVLSFISLCSLQVLPFEVPTFAKQRYTEPNGMYLGRGIFGCCKHVILEEGDPPKLVARLNKQDRNFEKTLYWVDEHMYIQHIHSPKTLSNERPEGWLRLYAIELPTDDQTKVVPSILIQIPLTKETLGPDCRKKIEQLKQVMTATE